MTAVGGNPEGVEPTLEQQIAAALQPVADAIKLVVEKIDALSTQLAAGPVPAKPWDGESV